MSDGDSNGKFQKTLQSKEFSETLAEWKILSCCRKYGKEKYAAQQKQVFAMNFE